jgi:hypothetical protein
VKKQQAWLRFILRVGSEDSLHENREASSSWGWLGKSDLEGVSVFWHLAERKWCERAGEAIDLLVLLCAPQVTNHEIDSLLF